MSDNRPISELSDDELAARIAQLRETRVPALPGQSKKSKPKRLDAADEGKPRGKRASVFDSITSTRSTISED